MIRFLDTEVFTIDKNDYDRDQLFGYFLNRRSSKDKNGIELVLLYEGTEYYGLATYESLLKRSGKDGIHTQKYVMGSQEELFAGLQHVFDESPQNAGYIPVFNKDMQLLYFAYQYVGEQVYIEKYAFSLFDSREDALFVKDLYPQIEKVSIYDFNEWAYRFYKALKARNFPVEVFGEKWQMLCPEIYEKDGMQNAGGIAEHIMNIYAEGNQSVMQAQGFGKLGYKLNIYASWRIIFELVKANSVYEMDKLKKEVEKKGIYAQLMLFPEFSQLKFYTTDEYVRNSLCICLESGPLVETKPLAVQQINKCWCKEGQDKVKDALTVEGRRNSQSLMIGDGGVQYRCFGQGRHTLYLIGPCIVEGIMVDTEDSLGACIYREIQKIQGGGYTVKCMFAPREDVCLWRPLLESLDLYEGDIVIFINVTEKRIERKFVSGYPGDVDVQGILARRTSDWFWDIPIHTNQRGNAQIAKALVEEYLSGPLRERTSCNRPALVQAGSSLLPRQAEEELEAYVANVREVGLLSQHIGAIVMNCNPMTKGHQYLIEQALSRVDFLYIFLVEEDKSEFSFADRLAMVTAVTEKYGNVKVVPSGKFILSYETMPIYFEKAKKQEEIVDATQDLKIFAEKIAPKLGITVRFVGEEPNDKVTRQYNEAMKRLLPAYGICLTEIPRMEASGAAISASSVRKYLHEGNLPMVKELMPKEAYDELSRKRRDSNQRHHTGV